jgi:toxin-antitoxin system PIN domain toxin
VKVADVNLLIYTYDQASPQHARARHWLEERLSGSETFAFAWIVLLAFVRLVTSPRVFAQPLTPSEALDVLDAWLAQPCATVIHPGDRHAALLRELLEPFGTAGNLTTDAHLAALAIEHGAELCSADADFSRFPGLVWSNPLATT